MPTKSSPRSAQFKKQHAARMLERWNAFSEHVAREQAAGSTRLANVYEVFPDSSSYGWDSLSNFQLLAIIPTNSEQHSYYTLKGYGVAFLADYTGVPLDKQFVFDSEATYLNGASGKPKDAYHAHIMDNPVVVFFHGGDDGHVGMRFSSKENAAAFVDVLDAFDDVFDFDKNHKALHKAIMSAETLAEQKKQLSLTLCYHN